MKFLSKLAQVLSKGLQLWRGFAPMIQAAIPGQAGTITLVSSELAQLADVVATVELAAAALNLTGPDKLKMSIPLIAQVYLKSSLLAGRKIHDEALFMAGVEKVASGTADIVNSFDNQIDTVSKS